MRLSLLALLALLALALTACQGAPSPAPTATALALPTQEATAAPAPTATLAPTPTPVNVSKAGTVSVSSLNITTRPGVEMDVVGMTVTVNDPYFGFAMGSIVWDQEFEIPPAIGFGPGSTSAEPGVPVQVTLVIRDTVPPGVYTGKVPVVFHSATGPAYGMAIPVRFEVLDAAATPTP